MPTPGRQPVRVLNVATLATFTLLLCVWSAVVGYGAAGALAAAIGAVPVFGWLVTIIRFGLLPTPFGLMVVFWFAAAAGVWAAGKVAE